MKYVKTFKDYQLNEGAFWPKSKLSQSFELLLKDELKKIKGLWYVEGTDLYRDDKKVLTIDSDKDSVDSIIKKIKK